MKNAKLISKTYLKKQKTFFHFFQKLKSII